MIMLWCMAREFADVIRVTHKITLKLGDYLGRPHRNFSAPAKQSAFSRWWQKRTSERFEVREGFGTRWGSLLLRWMEPWGQDLKAQGFEELRAVPAPQPGRKQGLQSYKEQNSTNNGTELGRGSQAPVRMQPVDTLVSGLESPEQGI